MKKKIKFNAYIPLRFIDVHKPLKYKYYVEVFQELIESDYFYYEYKENKYLVEFRAVVRKSKKIKELMGNDFASTTNVEILVAEIVFPIKDLYEKEWSIDNIISFLADDLEKWILDLMLLVNIAKPGMFITSKGFILVGNDVVGDIKSLFNNFSEALDSAKKFKWPKIEMLKIKKCYKWFKNYEESINLISKSSVGRALNSLTYLFHEYPWTVNGSEDLFWSVLGIEALYLKGEKDVVKVLNEKTQSFLGDRKEFKKIFNIMYNFRSRFVHGDLNFPNKFCIYDANEEYEKFYIELEQNKDIVLAVLLSTFQKMIKLDIHELNFEYKLIDRH